MSRLFLSSFFSLFLFFSSASGADFTPVRDIRTADALAASQKYKEALSMYRDALASLPKSASASSVHLKMADIYFKLGEFKNALASYRTAILDPALSDKPQTQYWIGFCCFLIGRDAEAVDEFLKITSLYPEAKAWGATAYYWAGRASERMGKKEQAAEYYRRAGGNGKTIQGKFALKKIEKLKR